MNPDPTLGVASGSNSTSWVHAALVAAAIVVAFGQLRRQPALAFGVLWFFLWLLPTNSLLPRLDVANDRQLYLALIGPAWLAGLALARLARPVEPAGNRKPAIGWAVSLVALISLTAFATIRQNRIYANEVTYWEAVAQRSPASARAADNLGFAYAMACRPSDAAREFERAIRLDPDDVRARVNARLLQEGALLSSSRPNDCAQTLRN
jgi:tetratricopeptide (TPR) repeat protein